MLSKISWPCPYSIVQKCTLTYEPWSQFFLLKFILKLLFIIIPDLFNIFIYWSTFYCSACEFNYIAWEASVLAGSYQLLIDPPPHLKLKSAPQKPFNYGLQLSELQLYLSNMTLLYILVFSNFYPKINRMFFCFCFFIPLHN